MKICASIRTILIFSLPVVLIAAGCNFGGPNSSGSSSTPSSAGPQLSVQPTKFVFPDTTVGASSSTATSTVSNSGDQPLQIAGITDSNISEFPGSSSCFATGATSGSLAAGQSCQVTVNFAPKAVGTRTALAVFNTNAGTASISYSGNGISGPTPTPVPGSPHIHASSQNLFFETTPIGGSCTTVDPASSEGTSNIVTISNTGSGVLQFNFTETDAGDNGTAEVREFPFTTTCGNPGSLAGGQSCSISFRFTPTAGDLQGIAVNFRSNDTNPFDNPVIVVLGCGSPAFLAPCAGPGSIPACPR